MVVLSRVELCYLFASALATFSTVASEMIQDLKSEICAPFKSINRVFAYNPLSQ